MKKYKLTINGNKYDVNILNFDDNVIELDVNGKQYEVEIEQKTAPVKTPQLVRAKSEALGPKAINRLQKQVHLQRKKARV